jgi:hypothetical protein
MKISKKNLHLLIEEYLNEAFKGRIGKSRDETQIYWEKEPEYDEKGKPIPGTGKLSQNTQGRTASSLSYDRDRSKDRAEEKEEFIQSLGIDRKILPGFANTVMQGKEKLSDPLTVQKKSSGKVYDKKLNNAFSKKSFPSTDVYVIPLIGNMATLGGKFSKSNPDDDFHEDRPDYTNTLAFKKAYPNPTEKDKKEWLDAGHRLVDDERFIQLRSKFSRYFNLFAQNRHIVHPLDSSESFNIISELGVDVEEMERIDVSKDIIFVPVMSTANPNYMGYPHLIAHAIFDISQHPNSIPIVKKAYDSSRVELLNLINTISNVKLINKDQGLAAGQTVTIKQKLRETSSNKSIYNFIFESIEIKTEFDSAEEVKEAIYSLLTTAAGRNRKADALADVIAEFYAQEFLKETPAHAVASTLSRGSKVEMVFKESGLNFPKEVFAKFGDPEKAGSNAIEDLTKPENYSEIQKELVRLREGIRKNCIDIKEYLRGKIVVIDVS